MSVIDLTAAVTAALRTDPHYPQCTEQNCVFCQETHARVEAMVIAAAPAIVSAAWSMRPDAEDGLQVRQQWAVKMPNGRVRSRNTEDQARALAHAWGGQLLVQDVYAGTSDWRPVEDLTQIWGRSHA